MPSRHSNISIVEDEPVLRQQMAFQLQHLGFFVKTFASAGAFYRDLAVAHTAVAVLDIGLPGEDGLSICKHLREHDTQMGIVFVTARSARSDRLVGLASGADAYLPKPVDIEELALVLKRLLQRMAVAASPTPSAPPPPTPVMAGGTTPWRLELGILSRLIAPNGAQKRLSHNERVLLGLLAQKIGKVCGHAALAVALGWHPDEYDKHRLEVIVSRLRNSVERATGLELPLTAARGLGYCLTGMHIDWMPR